jgi:hypothetical protein
MCGCRAKSGGGSASASRGYAVSATTPLTVATTSTTIANVSQSLTLVLAVQPIYRTFIPAKYRTGGGTAIKLHQNERVSLDSRLATHLISISSGQVGVV